MSQKLNANTALQLAERIRKERKSRKLTLVQLGAACGVHHSQLSRIEQGQTTRVSKNIEKICTFLQITPGGFDKEAGDPLLSRVGRLIASSKTSARAIESLVIALEELVESSTSP